MKSVPSPSSSHVQDEKKWSLADGGQRKQSNVFPQRFITFIYINDLQVNHLKLSPADRIIFYKLPRFHSIVFTLLSCQIHFQAKTTTKKNQNKTHKQTKKPTRNPSELDSGKASAGRSQQERVSPGSWGAHDIVSDVQC